VYLQQTKNIIFISIELATCEILFQSLISIYPLAQSNMWLDLRKGILYMHPIFQLWWGITCVVVKLLLQNFVDWILHHQTTLWPNLKLITLPHMELHYFKVAKSDVCIRPLFANPVTYCIKSYFWEHFTANFHPDDPYKLHSLCPCSSCTSINFPINYDHL